jgi:hypothetical protein
MSSRQGNTRPRHYPDEPSRREVTLDSGHVVTSAKGYVVMIDAMRNGRWQTIAVDPLDVDNLVSELFRAVGVPRGTCGP